MRAAAVLILFFLSSLLSGTALFFRTVSIYLERNSRQEEELTRAAALAAEINGALQPLKDVPLDHRELPLLGELLRRYAPQGLEIGDVSSGYHLNFLSDTDLADPLLADFLFTGGGSGPFTAWRESRGLSMDAADLRPFIKDSAWDHCVFAGWLNPALGDSFALRFMKRRFGRTHTADLFPLVNSLPPININMIDPAMLEPLVKRPAFAIAGAKEKFEALKTRLREGPLSVEGLASLLGISVRHPLFSYLGVKTSFWRLRFKMESGPVVEALCAAIPEPDGTIARYLLIDRSIRHEP